MHASDSQLQAHRGRRFWLAGCLAISIICLSYANRSLVEALNISLLHTSASDQRGWWIYSLARLLPVAALLWCIFRAPEQAGLPSIKPSSLQANGALFDPLLGLRALACFFVLMGHYFLVVFPFTLGATPRLVQALLHTSPWAGVWLFFTLSGFLMGKAFSHSRYSLDESGMRHFLRNRFLRLLPVYYVCILLIVIYRNPEVLHLHNAWIMLEMTTFDYRGDLSLNPNGALWSVSTEMQFYFLVPILMLALLRLRKEIGDLMFAVPLLLLLAGRAFRIYLTRHHVDTYYSVGYAPLLPNLDLFVTGMSLNLLPRLRAVPALLVRYRGPILLTAGVTFYAWESWITEQQRVNLPYYWAHAPLPCSIFTACFIYLSEQCGRLPIRPGLSGTWLKTMHWTGTLTYCLYVFHPDVMISNASTLPTVHSLRTSLTWWPMVMLQVVAIAALFYFAVEQPFEKWKKVSGTALADAP